MKIRCEHCYATFRGNPLKDRCPKCRYKVHRNLESKEATLSLLIPGYGWIKTFTLWRSVPFASLQALALSVINTGVGLALIRAVLRME
jgi:hypothetical protein